MKKVLAVYETWHNHGDGGDDYSITEAAWIDGDADLGHLKYQQAKFYMVGKEVTAAEAKELIKKKKK